MIFSLFRVMANSESKITAWNLEHEEEQDWNTRPLGLAVIADIAITSGLASLVVLQLRRGLLDVSNLKATFL